MTRAPVLLVLRALGLGDFLAAVPAYRGLVRAFPGHHRVLAAPRALHPLLALLEGVFAGALDAQPLAPLPEAAARAAVAVNLHGSGPASHRVLLATQPGRLIAFAHPDIPASAEGPAWNAHEHEVARWCRLLEHARFATDARDLGLAVPALAVPGERRGATILHAGAASAARRWPAKRWVEVARACRARGERVLLSGSGIERPLALAIAERAGLPETRVVAGETTLLELAALVAQARCVLSGDTGIAHLASAYGVASIVLFGPTPPQHWGPPQHPRHRVIWTGRTGNPNADAPDRGLLEITSARVIAELANLRDGAED